MNNYTEFFKKHESGGAFNGLSPIPAEYQKATIDVFLGALMPKLGICEKQWSHIGSTFKKKPGQTSGDIDIAICGSAFGTDATEKVYNILTKTFPGMETNLTKGLRVTNIKFPQYNQYNTKTGQFVQIDLMVVTDIELAKFIYHSPDFTKNESNYKGVYRTELIWNIIKNIDHTEAPILYGDEFGGIYKGQIKSFKKYSMTALDGLKVQTKSFEGKNCRLKNANTLDNFEFVTKDVNEISKFILGPTAVPFDLNSFESIWAWIHSDKFVHKHNIENIKANYILGLTKKNLPIPFELR